MARVTVEDCLEKIPNRFELVHIASQRAHMLELGISKSIIDNENNKVVEKHKPTVAALKEIATEGTNLIKLIRENQKDKESAL